MPESMRVQGYSVWENKENDDGIRRHKISCRAEMTMLYFEKGTVVLQGGSLPKLAEEGRWCDGYL